MKIITVNVALIGFNSVVCRELGFISEGNELRATKEVREVLEKYLAEPGFATLRSLGWSIDSGRFIPPEYSNEEIISFFKENVSKEAHLLDSEEFSPVFFTVSCGIVDDYMAFHCRLEFKEFPKNLVRVPHYAMIKGKPFVLISACPGKADYQHKDCIMTLRTSTPYFHLDAVEISYEEYVRSGGTQKCEVITTYDKVVSGIKPYSYEEISKWAKTSRDKELKDLYDKFGDAPFSLEEGSSYLCICDTNGFLKGRTYVATQGKLGGKYLPYTTKEQFFAHFVRV